MEDVQLTRREIAQATVLRGVKLVVQEHKAT